MIAPGGTIGILGGGQLGRMTALAAARLGYRVHVFTPEADSPCAQVAAAATVAEFNDHAALAAFAQAVDVVTLEWENVPVEAVRYLEEGVPVRPGSTVLAVTRDRLEEKAFLNRHGIATAPWRAAYSTEDVLAAAAELGLPAVLKAATLGYDGKGQVRLDSPLDPQAAWHAMGAGEAIVEGYVRFEREISVIVARGGDGGMASYPAVENQHTNHILARTIVPAPISAETAAEADRIARRVARALDLTGLVAVEMFVTHDNQVLVNELAPRPHNSGHWTIDACPTSQFEQLVRAVCHLPLGPTTPFHPAVMENLLGDQVSRWPEFLAEPGAHLHLYGKTEVRPGRKLGHVTRLVGR
ncbi:N5-carboxyaminoimidazole ribonucleotide synthase [uncultured Gammaproteobacteria bacterium]